MYCNTWHFNLLNSDNAAPLNEVKDAHRNKFRLGRFEVRDDGTVWAKQSNTEKGKAPKQSSDDKGKAKTVVKSAKVKTEKEENHPEAAKKVKKRKITEKEQATGIKFLHLADGMDNTEKKRSPRKQATPQKLVLCDISNSISKAHKVLEMGNSMSL